jgi:hypothetical protein
MAAIVISYQLSVISYQYPREPILLDLLHKSEKLTISNFGFWILD